MVNTQLLEAKIKTSGLKIGYICDELKLSRQCFRNKVNNSAPLKVDEFFKLCDLLNITDNQEKLDIFFV